MTMNIPNQWWQKSFRFKNTIESRPLKMIIDPRNLTNDKSVKKKTKMRMKNYSQIEDDHDDKRKNWE